MAEGVPSWPDDFGESYAIEHELGHGGTSTVYLARDLENGGRLVAIKVLAHDFAFAVPLERFQREIETTARLNHPHIVTLFRSGRLPDDRPYFVMKYIEGETLHDRIVRARRLPVAEALHIARQVAGALAYAHRHGVIHRDVKPTNIMLEGDHTWVTDFGIARQYTRGGPTVTTTGTGVGTPAYMSPEQVVGDPNLDPRTDVYSLGCVLYEMLTGRMPFDSPDIQTMLEQHLTVIPPPVRSLRPDVPPGVDSLVMRALAKHREDRFDNAAELERALAFQGAGELTPPETQPVRVDRRHVIRWKSAPVVAAGVTCVVGVLGLAAWALANPASLDATRFLLVPRWSYEGVSPGMNASRLLEDQLHQWKGLAVIVPSDSGRQPAAAARHARAAWYITGIVSRVGDSLRVRAQLYATRGDSLVRERTVNLPMQLIGVDEPLGRLADQVIFDDTVWAATGGRVGTRSMQARRAFARGLQAVQVWDLTAADTAFRQASDADPGFPQAHLWVAQVRFWDEAQPPLWQSYAERAAAGTAGLSARDARISDALLAIGRGDQEQGWRLFDRLAAQQPYDFAAWYGLAMALNSDTLVRRDARSPSGWSFRASYARATKAYQRAFQLLPAIHRALSGSSFTAVRRLLMTSGNTLRFGAAAASDTTIFAAYPEWRGDSLAFHPSPLRDLRVPSTVRRAVQQERELFHDIAVAWVSSFPNSASAQQALAISLALLSNPAALDTLRRARSLAITAEERLRLAVDEVWMRVKFSLPRDTAGLRAARQLSDSLLSNARPYGDPQLLASLAILTGRANLAATFMRQPALAKEWAVPGPLVNIGLPLTVFSALGGPVDSIRALETLATEAIATMEPEAQPEARARWAARAAALAFPAYRFASLRQLRGPELPVLDAEYALTVGDTGAVRRVLEGRRAARVFAAPSDLTLDVLYPEAWLLVQLGDPQAAVAWLDPPLAALPATSPQMFFDPAIAGALLRAALLRRDLAAERGDSTEARTWRAAMNVLLSDADDFLRAGRR